MFPDEDPKPVPEPAEAPKEAEESEEEVVETETPEKPSSEVEKIARDIGWRPQEEWKGPPENWRDPIDFIKRGASMHRELREELSSTRNKFDATEAEYRNRFDRLEKTAKLALELQKKQINDNWEAQKAHWAAQGDTENYNAARKAQEAANAKVDEEIAASVPQGAPQLAPEAVSFITRNSGWYGKDPVMTGAAREITGYYQQLHPNVPLSGIFEMVDRDMRQNFPSRFNGAAHPPQTEQKPAPASVEGGLRPIRGAVKKGWEALPPEAKKAGSDFVDQGVFSGGKRPESSEDRQKARQAYADQYWSLG